MKGKDRQKEIEEVLGNVSRLRILKYLTRGVDSGETFSRYKLKQLTGIRSKDLDRHLRILVENEWVEEIKIDHIRKYRLNMGNPKVVALTQFFKKVENI